MTTVPTPRLGLIAAALCAFAALSSSARAQDDESRRPEVRNIVFEGVKAVSKDGLKSSIALDESGCRSWLVKPICLFTKSDIVYEHHELDRSELRRDVVRIKVFYYRRGYRETQVDTTVSPKDGGVEVRFRVTEGPPTIVTRVAVEYPPDILSKRRVSDLMLLRADRPLNLLQLDSSLVRLRSALWDEGYADAEVTTESLTVSPETRTARVTVRVDPKYLTTVGEVTVEGNEEVSDRTIRSSLYFTSRDVFKHDDLMRSQRQLYRTNMFRRATITVAPDQDSVKNIVVTVQESPLHEVRTRVGFNTIEFFQTDARYIEYNWLGRGRQITLQGSIGNLGAEQLNGTFPFRNVLRGFDGELDAYLKPTWHASADVVQPAFFFSPSNSGGFGVFAHRRSSPGIFVDRGFGGTVSFTRDLAPAAPLSASYRLEFATVEAGDVYFCVNFGVCQPSTIDALRDRQRLAPVALAFHVNRASSPLSPRHGYVARADIEHASAYTTSDFRYNRAAAEGAVYRPVGDKGTLSAHLKLGWVRPLASTGSAIGVLFAAGEDILHPRKRFYAGGARSVRGFGENQLGPRVLTISDETLRGRSVNDSTGEVTYSRCAPPTPIQQCDPNDEGLFDRYFFPRPIGGNSLLEGSVELRMPLFWKLTGAVFVDGGLVGEGGLGSLTSATGAITPGFGFRYQSPVGPIRVDFGINPRLKERLTVITEDRSGGDREIVRLERARMQYPRENPDGFIGWMKSRLTLHLSIGEAY